ncbi:MAG: adenosylcobinamide-GDP ribazoletransferase [Nitrospirota bacterium]
MSLTIFNSIITAFKFLTILPLGGYLPDERAIGKSIVFFPFVGITIGGILYISDYLLSTIFTRSVVDALLITVLVIITGGLHIDGFADTVDGIAGGKNPQDRLRIMKESNIGAVGVSCVVLLLLIKYSALLSIIEVQKGGALLMAPMISRWSQVQAICMGKSAREDGLGRIFIENGSAVKFLFATAFVTSMTIFVLPLIKVLLLLAIIFIISLIFLVFFNRMFNGVTGDAIGSVSEINEVIVLLVLLAMQ